MAPVNVEIKFILI